MEQLPQRTTVWEWLNTVVMLKQPWHFTSMKKELGDCTRRFSLCFRFSSSAGGCKRSISLESTMMLAAWGPRTKLQQPRWCLSCCVRERRLVQWGEKGIMNLIQQIEPKSSPKYTSGYESFCYIRRIIVTILTPLPLAYQTCRTP